MAIWNKLKNELDRAGRAASHAIDEGKLRLESFRARQIADRAAQALGWAVYRARVVGEVLDPATLARLADAVGEREAELKRIEDQIRAGGGTPPAEGETAP